MRAWGKITFETEAGSLVSLEVSKKLPLYVSEEEFEAITNRINNPLPKHPSEINES